MGNEKQAMPSVVIDQRTGEQRLTDASYATVLTAWNAANNAGDGFPFGESYPYKREETNLAVLHEANRTDELNVYREEDGSIIAVSNDGWACVIASPATAYPSARRAEENTYSAGFGGYLKRTAHGSYVIADAYGRETLSYRIEIDETNAWTIAGIDDDFIPLIVRLPHGRGFWHGWTSGEGMIASVPDLHVAELADDAWLLARDDAERAADAEADYQASEEAADEENAL